MRPTLYLHGFLSHPNSAKPKLLREAHEKIGKPFIAPELYMSPEEVAAFLSKLIKEDLEGGPVDVIGSSLGGFYAAWAKEHLPVVKAVLLNPALGNWGKVDFQPGWHKVSGLDREMYVCSEFMIQLEKMLVKDLKKPQDYLSLISLKDKVLDPTQTLDFLKHTKIVKIPDGDHRITDFAPHVEEIMSFLAE